MRALVQWQCFRAGLCLCLSFGTVAGAQTWDLIGPPGAVFIASSANGSNLVSREYLGYLQLSADSGASWSSGSDMAFGSLASSAKGVKLAGIFGNQYWSFVSPIYTSEDYGQSWTPTGSPTTNWAAIAMSADGTTIIAGHFGATWQTGGGMFVSTNSGQTWIRANVPNLWWSAVACSADGRRFVAGAWQDSIYISSDLGATWVPTAAPQKQWRSLACSTDATKLVASTADYYISYFSSTNSARRG